ncbi:hypothetical protein C5167_007196 [Papaver somniferum]|uniref:Uncharacterized protein n=1 Tax=Papaver somniferum TaxID=3469 RepID=A0A4Y7JJG2_PAPSO|nr:hypothetical protein C5167_007196 [Papaver somniferum]
MVQGRRLRERERDYKKVKRSEIDRGGSFVAVRRISQGFERLLWLSFSFCVLRVGMGRRSGTLPIIMEGLQPRLKGGRQGSSQGKNANDSMSGGVPTSNQNQQAITSGQQILQSIVARGSNARKDSKVYLSM